MKRGRPRLSDRGALTSGEIAFTVRDAAQYLNCHTSTLYRLLKAGELPSFRLGGDYRLFRSEIDRWIARHHVSGGDVVAELAAAGERAAAPARKGSVRQRKA